MTAEPKDIFIYNSMSRKKELFVPLVPLRVSMYVCGPTVYGHSHIGHAKSYVSFDVIYRWLEELGYKVKYIQNITDVGHLTDDGDEGEDKIQKKANEEKIDPMEISQYYTRSFYEDMDSLFVKRPTVAPVATGHIPEQIEMIQTLIKKNYAYEVNGSVYFSVETFKSYGKLSRRKDQDAQQSGYRISVHPDKRSPFDFALWKRADEKHLMKWASPWGKGYPGWHIECSTMAKKYLGKTLDIHGGGLENQFPHHECEIAQSEAANEKPFARYWLHNNMVTVNGVKMGKSLRNFTTIKDVLKKTSPRALRFFILQSHYRNILDFSDEGLNASNAGLQKLIGTFQRLKRFEPTNENDTLNIDSFDKACQIAMNDDFNTPAAIAILFDFSKTLNGLLDQRSISRKDKTNAISFFEKYGCEVLDILSKEDVHTNYKEIFPKVMEILLDIRKQAREKKDFVLSDSIRNTLSNINIEIKDGVDGTTWKMK